MIVQWTQLQSRVIWKASKWAFSSSPPSPPSSSPPSSSSSCSSSPDLTRRAHPTLAHRVHSNSHLTTPPCLQGGHWLWWQCWGWGWGLWWYLQEGSWSQHIPAVSQERKSVGMQNKQIKSKKKIQNLHWIQKNVETPVIWDLGRKKGNSSCHKIPTVFKQSSICL